MDEAWAARESAPPPCWLPAMWCSLQLGDAGAPVPYRKRSAMARTGPKTLEVLGYSVPPEPVIFPFLCVFPGAGMEVVMSQLKVCVDQVRSLPLNAQGRMVLDPKTMWRQPEDTDPEPMVVDVGFTDDDHGLKDEVRSVAS